MVDQTTPSSQIGISDFMVHKSLAEDVSDGEQITSL